MLQRRSFESNAMIRLYASEDFKNPLEPTLRLGDVVSLNSGGPASMIVDLDGSGGATICYQTESGETVEASFPVVCLHRRSLISSSR